MIQGDLPNQTWNTKLCASIWGLNSTDLVRIKAFFEEVVRKRSELTTKSLNLWMKTTCKSSLHLKTCYIEGKLIVYDPSSDFVIGPLAQLWLQTDGQIIFSWLRGGLKIIIMVTFSWKGLILIEFWSDFDWKFGLILVRFWRFWVWFINWGHCIR